MRVLIPSILVIANLIVALTDATASTRPVHRHRMHYSRGGAPGMPITEGSSLVRINAVGEVIEPQVNSTIPKVK